MHLGIDELLARHVETYYFPSYEILMDDLRDYRFYAADMLHPSAEAIDYIWNHFTKHLYSSETLALVKNVASITQAINHRPFHPDSSEHQQFLKKNLQKIESLEKVQSDLDFSLEKNQLKELLH